LKGITDIFELIFDKGNCVCRTLLFFVLVGSLVVLNQARKKIHVLPGVRTTNGQVNHACAYLRPRGAKTAYIRPGKSGGRFICKDKGCVDISFQISSILYYEHHFKVHKPYSVIKCKGSLIFGLSFVGTL